MSQPETQPALPTSNHDDDPHFMTRSNWLRAAVLGANDGIVSVSAIIVGVAAATTDARSIAIAGVAGLVAGAMSMAAGEYVSVSSQSDTEQADMRREAAAIEADPEGEMAELAMIWEGRGLSPQTAAQVARELHHHDALAAHMRDEIGVTEVSTANPLQAAAASGVTFSAAAIWPVLAALLAPAGLVLPVVLVVTLLLLAVLGALGAHAGGAPKAPAVLRVVIWGAFAMAATAGVGALFGVAV